MPPEHVADLLKGSLGLAALIFGLSIRRFKWAMIVGTALPTLAVVLMAMVEGATARKLISLDALPIILGMALAYLILAAGGFGIKKALLRFRKFSNTNTVNLSRSLSAQRIDPPPLRSLEGRSDRDNQLTGFAHLPHAHFSLNANAYLPRLAPSSRNGLRRLIGVICAFALVITFAGCTAMLHWFQSIPQKGELIFAKIDTAGCARELQTNDIDLAIKNGDKDAVDDIKFSDGCVGFTIAEPTIVLDREILKGRLLIRKKSGTDKYWVPMQHFARTLSIEMQFIAQQRLEREKLEHQREILQEERDARQEREAADAKRELDIAIRELERAVQGKR